MNKVIQNVNHPRFVTNPETFTYYNLYHPNGALASELRDSMTVPEASSAQTTQDHKPHSARVRYVQDPTNKGRTKSYEIDVYRQINGGVVTWDTVGATQMTYDAKGRLATVASNSYGTLTQGNPDLTHTYTYHDNSAIPSLITSNDSTKDVFRSTYVVNRRGQTTDVLSHYIKKGNGNVLGLRTAVGYQYNEVGQRTKVTREDGHYWKYSYNDRGEVIAAKKHEPTGDQPLGGLQYEYQYDDIGNRTEMKYGGDKNGGNLRTVDYQTNGQNQYTQISHPGYHHVTGLAGLAGQPPAIGTVKVNTSQVTANEFQGSFFYKEFQESRATTPVSVPISIEETPSQGKKMTQTLGDVYVSKEDVVPQYQNGNLINDGRWIYLWSANNRLRRMEPTPEAIAAHSAAGHTTDLPILDFLYDWKGRRISKRVTYGTASNSPFTITSYVYDGWNIVAAIDRTYNDLDLKIVRSIWGLDLSGGFQGAGGVGGLLATRTTDSNSDGYFYTTTEVERHFPSYDGNGNIIAWTTDSGGTATTRDFDAFGNVVTNQGLRWSSSTPYGFSTKCEDAETGLLYYGYRYYDPVTGRWPSRDPIGERGGVNLYGMVGNDAVGRRDYLGLLEALYLPMPVPTGESNGDLGGVVADVAAEAAGFIGIEGMTHGLSTRLVSEYIARGDGFTLRDEEFIQAVWGKDAKRRHPDAKTMDPGTHRNQIMTMQQDNKGEFLRDARQSIALGGKYFFGGKYRITTYATQVATLGNFSMYFRGKFCVKANGDYTGWAAVKASDKFDFNKSTHRTSEAEATTSRGRFWLGEHSFWVKTKVYTVYVEGNINRMYDGFIELKTPRILGLYEEKGIGVEGTGEGSRGGWYEGQGGG